MAVLLIDVINHMKFPGGLRLAEQASPTAERISALRRAARRAQVPVIYANDNFGDWCATSAELVRFCSSAGHPGAAFTRKVRPAPHFAQGPGSPGLGAAQVVQPPSPVLPDPRGLTNGG